MTRNEFNNLKIGQIIIGGCSGAEFRVDRVDPMNKDKKSYYITKVHDNSSGYACIPQAWKLKDKVIKLGVQHEDK